MSSTTSAKHSDRSPLLTVWLAVHEPWGGRARTNTNSTLGHQALLHEEVTQSAHQNLVYGYLVRSVAQRGKKTKLALE